MDRRGFLRTLIGGVAAGAAVRTFPFRVFSFPTEITIPSVEAAPAEALALENSLSKLSIIYYNKRALEQLREDFVFTAMLEPRNVNLFQYNLHGAA